MERRATTLWWLPPRRGVVDRVPGWRRTSDALCRTPGAADPLDPNRLEAPRTASPAPSSKGAASSIQNAFHRQVAPEESRLRGTVFVGARHRYLGFATEDPASGALSPPRCSRPEWLDPMSVPGALHPGPRGAKRRLSTSAIYCDPRAHPTDRPNPAHRAGGRPPAQLSFRATVFRRRNGLRVATRVTAPPIEMSRARGLLSGGIRPLRDLAPPAAIARGGSFTPTRSARTPHVANPWRRRLE